MRREPALRDAAFRCAATSLLRDEDLAGTASTVRAFLLVEVPGPWGVDALRDCRLPEDVRTGLGRRAGGAGVRVLLIRRPGRPAPTSGHRVFAVHADAVDPWIETTVVGDPAELLTLDLDALAAGRSPGLTPYDASVLAVCTHGRHDVCCAERGRPVAAALAQAHPEETWEVSHIGGDRFAANMVVLPHGLYYGRLDERSALAIAGGHLAGELDLDHLRGRSGLPMPVQAAEIALRRRLGVTRDADVRRLRSRRTDQVTTADFALAGGEWTVEVRTTPGDKPRRLTCGATRDNPVPRHDVLTVTSRS
ncbi:sucrase ferredoxin [Nocardioides pacificus]